MPRSLHRTWPGCARRRIGRAGLSCAGIAAAPLAFAQAAAPAAAPAAMPPSMAPLALALLCLLALVVGAAWLVKRSGGSPRAGVAGMRVVSQLALGPRERVVVVEVGERWWLLGVGAGGVTRLGTMPKGETPPGAVPAAAFQVLLSRLAGGQK